MGKEIRTLGDIEIERQFYRCKCPISLKDVDIEPETCNFIKKEALAQVFSCEFCEISKNTFFYGTALVAALWQDKII